MPSSSSDASRWALHRNVWTLVVVAGVLRFPRDLRSLGDVTGRIENKNLFQPGSLTLFHEKVYPSTLVFRLEGMPGFLFRSSLGSPSNSAAFCPRPSLSLAFPPRLVPASDHRLAQKGREDRQRDRCDG